MSARPPTSTRYATLFPYTPLCRSGECAGRAPNPADPRYREPGDNPVGPVGQDDADARALAEAEREQPLRHGRRLRLDVGIARFAAVGDHRDAPLVTRDHPLPPGGDGRRRQWFERRRALDRLQRDGEVLRRGLHCTRHLVSPFTPGGRPFPDAHADRRTYFPIAWRDA